MLCFDPHSSQRVESLVIWIVFINRIDFVIISFAKSAIKPCPKHHFSSLIQMWKLQLRFVTQNCNTFSYSGLRYHFNSSNSLSILRRKSSPRPFLPFFSMCPPPHLSFFPIPASFHQSLSLSVSLFLSAYVMPFLSISSVSVSHSPLSLNFGKNCPYSDLTAKIHFSSVCEFLFSPTPSEERPWVLMSFRSGSDPSSETQSESLNSFFLLKLLFLFVFLTF